MPFPLYSTASKRHLLQTCFENDADMIPVNYPHNFGLNRQQSHQPIGSGVYKRDPRHFSGCRQYQEELEPIELLSSMKQQFHDTMEEQQSTMAATSAKQENRQQQQDVAIVQPSFDDHESRSHAPEKKSIDMGKASSSREGHHRNLSEHFEDATRLTKGLMAESGQKHRRDYSGDVSNPAQAHRRIDSAGGSASIQRSRPHRRIDSTGLDALTAAADFSREELEAASQGRQPWSQHSNLRRSPIETTKTFEHASHGSAPAPAPHPSPPHITSNVAHHRHYPPVNGSGRLQTQTVYYNHPTTYPPPTYPHTYHYPPPHHHHSGSIAYGRHHGQPLHPPLPNGYPVQYARPHGQDPYAKHHSAPLQQPTLERPHTDSPTRRASPTVTSIDHKQTALGNTTGMRPPPPPPQWPRGGSTQGVQTYITGIGAGETTRTLQANPPASHAPPPRSSPTSGHHRKLSSLSNLGPLFFGQDPGVPGGRHHRSTSSSMSFLNSLDVTINDSADATFLRNLQESTGTPAAGYSAKNLQEKVDPAKQSSSTTQSKLMAGGTSKRVRRKCTVVGCDNRVVQGGLCIAHGAKRKLCKHPGCKKHVKKAGLCSTHGPARKRCEVENCTKVAVQGGRCIAHGAKKKLCSVDQCTKQAILGGMCKKHHDQKASGEEPVMCTVIPSKKTAKKSRHTRGLSIFQEISADAVGDLLSPEAGKQNPSKGAPTPAMV